MFNFHSFLTISLDYSFFSTQAPKGGSSSSNGARDAPPQAHRFNAKDDSDGLNYSRRDRKRDGARFDSRGPRRSDSRPFTNPDKFQRDLGSSRETGRLPYPGYMEEHSDRRTKTERTLRGRFEDRGGRFERREKVANDAFAELNDPRQEMTPEVAKEAYRFDRAAPQTKSKRPEQQVSKEFVPQRSAPKSQPPPPPPPTPKLSPEEAIRSLKDKIIANSKDLPARFDLALVHLKIAASSEAPSDATPSAAGRSKLASFWNTVNSHLSSALEQINIIGADQQFCQKLVLALQQKMSALQRADLLNRLNAMQAKLARDPADILSNIALAHLLLLQHGVTEVSIKRLQTALNLSQAEAIFSDALRTELNETQYAKAAEMYREVLKLQPDHSGALTNLAVYLYYKYLPKSLQEINNENTSAESAPQDSPTTPASIKRAEIVEEVRELLKRAAATNWNRKNHLCHYHLAYFLEIEDNSPEAAKMEYSKALMINDKHYPSHLNLGSLLMVDGLTDMALPHYRAAVKYSEGNMKVLPLFALSNALSRKGLLDEAVFYAKQAIVETEMKDPQAYYHLANIFLNNKKITDAIENYKRCIEISKSDPASQFDHAPAINNLIVTLRRAANMFISKGTTLLDFGTAARFLAEAIELTNKDGDNPDLVAIQRMNLSYCLMKAKQPDTAAKQIRIAIAEAGQSFLDNFREVKQAKISPEVIQQLEAHIDLAGTAPERTPDRARAHYNMAFCLFHMGEAAAAAGHLEEAVEHHAEATSDYLAQDDSSAVTAADTVQKKKKSKRVVEEDDEELVAVDDLDAVARAEKKDAEMVASKKKKSETAESDPSTPTTPDATEGQPPATQEQPSAGAQKDVTSSVTPSDDKKKTHKSKKLKREAIEKAVFGSATSGTGVVAMSDEDVGIMRDIIPLLKKRAAEAEEARRKGLDKNEDQDDDDDEIDESDLPKEGEKIMLMSKTQWQDIEAEQKKAKKSSSKKASKKLSASSLKVKTRVKKISVVKSSVKAKSVGGKKKSVKK